MAIEKISVSPPKSGQLVAILVALVAFSFVIAAFSTYTRKELVSGVIKTRGGDLRVATPMAGVVTYLVSPGAVVSKGQVLARISIPDESVVSGLPSEKEALRHSEKLSSLQREQTLREAADAASRASVEAKESATKSLLANLAIELKAREAVLSLEQTKVARLRVLRGQGVVSQAALDEGELTVLSRRAETQATQRLLEDAKAQLQLLANDANQIRTQGAIHQLQIVREISEATRNYEGQAKSMSREIVAPVDASSVTFLASSGSSVRESQPIIKLRGKASEFEVQLYLPASDLGRVKVGQQATISLPARPFQTYGALRAKITAMDATPLWAEEVPDSGIDKNMKGQVVRVTAELEADSQLLIANYSLVPGMAVEAFIQTERRTLLQWLAWPLLKYL